MLSFLQYHAEILFGTVLHLYINLGKIGKFYNIEFLHRKIILFYPTDSDFLSIIKIQGTHQDVLYLFLVFQERNLVVYFKCTYSLIQQFHFKEFAI